MENQSRRNRNQNFVVESYFLTALQSSENPVPFFGRNLLFEPTCENVWFFTDPANKAKKSIFSLRILHNINKSNGL